VQQRARHVQVGGELAGHVLGDRVGRQLAARRGRDLVAGDVGDVVKGRLGDPDGDGGDSEPKRAPSCRWSSGCLAIFGSSAKFPVHSSGMNRSLTTMSLLEVP